MVADPLAKPCVFLAGLHRAEAHRRAAEAAGRWEAGLALDRSGKALPGSRGIAGLALADSQLAAVAAH